MAEQATAAKTETQPAGSPRYSYYVLGVLFIAYVMNSLDRSILNVLMPAIKAEFDLSNTQLGLLGGLAFAVFYATMGIPIASLADRTNRKWVLTVCIAIWSGMTALCGLAGNFLALLAARIGTAVGEAGGSPPSHSLIADYFPLEKRGTALSIYALGVTVGGMIGLALGGWANQIWGWRVAFFLAGIPGLLVALLVATTVREPARSGPRPAARPNPFAAMGYLWKRPAFRNMSLAAALHAFVWYGAGNFNTLFFVETHGLTTGQAGSWMASFSIAGAFGTFLGGFSADKLAQRFGDERMYMLVPGISVILGIPFQVGGYLFDSLPIALVCFAISGFFASFFFGPSFAMAQGLAGASRRAVAASVLLFVQTMIGLGLGPIFAGAVSDALHGWLGDQALRWALAFVAFFNIWSALHYWLAARTVRADLAAARAEP